MSEISRAFPMHFYGDPALVVERAELDDLGCRICDQHGHVLDRVVCHAEKNVKQRGVPYIGHRCKWFGEKK